jgi:uncharacterized repeat protein (TIGR01451 family)
MPPLARRTRVILALAALVAALAAWQGAALGISIDSAKLDVTSNGDTNPATSVSSPAGGVIRADLDTSSGSWQSTRYDIKSDPPSTGTSTCHNGGGDFDLTAPAAPGTYDVEFQVFEKSNCSGSASGVKVLDKGLEVTAPRANPNLPARCGIDVQLILDRSGSIGSTHGATEAVRSAAKAFVGALSGTGSKVAIIDFSSTAALRIPYTTVDSTSISDVFNPYIDNTNGNGYNPNGWTNWEDAFRVSKQTNADDGVADLVVFITDGDPTARNRDNQAVTGLTEGEALSLTKAATEADYVKGQKSHVFAIGVGSAVTKPTSARRLTAVSGTDQYPDPQADFQKADYTLVEDFGDLAQALRDIAIKMCQSSVTITKLVDEGDGQGYHPAQGWKFTAEVSVPGGYRWVVPPPATPTTPRTQTTGDDGVATFQWKPTKPNASSTVSVTEAAVPGYEFVDYQCTTSAGGVGKRVTRGELTGTAATGVLKPNEYATCTVRNKKSPPELGSITIIKDAVPQSSTVFNFTGTDPIGAFKLSDDGKSSKVNPPSRMTFDGLLAGSYTVSEKATVGWRLTDLSCNRKSSSVVKGRQVTIDLRAGEVVTCRFQNTRNDKPDPPTPPDPPDPPTPPPPTPPTPTPDVTPSATAQLEVTKTAPASARVGERVAFSLTVTNVGPTPAENVRLRDLPPGAIALTDLRASAKPSQRGGGKTTWNVGTLQPGESRTISGTVAIRSGTPGSKHNTVIASADNAKSVSDYSDTVLVAQRRVIPPVTG